MKRLYPWATMLIIFTICVFAYFSLNSIENLQKIDIYKTNRSDKTTNILIMTINDKDQLKVISTIIKKSKKMPGILSVAPPEFILEIQSNDKSIKKVYLWIGKDNMQGMYMFENNTETGYSISMSNTKKLRSMMDSIIESNKLVNSNYDLTSLHIVLPTNWHLDTEDKWQYNFVDGKGKNMGWIIAGKYKEDAFSEWKPNHSQIIDNELIETILGKCRVFTLDTDNGTAASGIVGTHNSYYAIIPVKNSIRYIIEFSQHDKRPETKNLFINILKKLRFKS
jgi:hypothetical protein